MGKDKKKKKDNVIIVKIYRNVFAFGLGKKTWQ
jgi:hypothetical protein